MTNGTIFPAFLRLEYQPSDARNAFAAEVNNTMSAAEKRFSQFSAEAQRSIDQVLKRPLTASGSLDLGVSELQRTAAALKQEAVAARELATATEMAAKAAGDFSQTARLQVAATQAAAREAEQAAADAREYAAAQAQVQAQLNRTASVVDQTALATRRGGIANDNAAASSNALRYGMMDLGRQIGDVTTMYTLGAPVAQIYASQIGQVMQSVQLLTGGTSRLATFLGGPWGVALSSATIVLSPLIAKLFESSDAMDDASAAADRLANSLANLGNLKFDSSDLTAVQAQMLKLEAEAAALEKRAVQSGADRGAGGLYYRQQAQAKLAEAQALRRQLEDAVDPANPARVISNRNQAIYHARPDRASSRGSSTSAIEKQTAASEAAISALQQEIATIGKTQGQLRQLEIERLKAAATTDEQRAAIEQLNAEREEALTTQAREEAMARDAKALLALDARIRAITDETQMLSLVGPAREKAALDLEEEAFKAQAAADGIVDVEAAWRRYLEARTAQIDTESALERDRQEAELLAQELDRLIGAVTSLRGVGGIVGGLLGITTGNLGAIGGPIGALLNLPTGTTVDENGKVIARRIGDELTEIFGKAGPFGETLTDALKGAGIGMLASSAVFGQQSTASQIGSALGGALGNEAGKAIGQSIGGALGSAAGPIGSVVGSIVGSLAGGLLSSTKYGTASITGVDSLSAAGKGSGRVSGATSLGGAVQDSLRQIAEQLNAELGSFRVSIGTYKDDILVSTSGRTGKLKEKYGDVKDFGDDEGAAIAYAIMDAIKDGAIKGLRAGTQKLLKTGSDVERALQDALDFEGVFTRLKALKDPTGAALDDLDSEFERLQDLFTKASATTSEWADLEELYWLERDEIIKDATANSLSSLKGFLDELTIGNSALSLRDRKSAALAAYTPLANRVASGDATAYDDFVEAARALLDIERQMSGSQSGYFDLLNQVTSLTNTALGSSSSPNFADRDSPFGERGVANDNANVVAGIANTNTLLEQVRSENAATNRNFGTLIAQVAQLALARRNEVTGSGGGW